MFNRFGCKNITVNPQSSNKLSGRIKRLNFFILRECKINTKDLNMEVRVRNSNKKARYF